MRVLLVSQYFPPESGATQNRMAAFASGLVERGHEVTVVCEQPNHPSGRFRPGFGKRPWQHAKENGQDVYRLWVAASPRKTSARRLLFYGTFALGAALAAGCASRPDVVLATSPPLPGALAACGIARARRVPYVLDVRDLWPAAAEALGELSQGAAMKAAEQAEAWLYRHAAVVAAATRPFCLHISDLSPQTPVVHLPNGALDSILSMPPQPEPAPTPFVVGYVGNLGIAQGLSILIDAASDLRTDGVRLRIVGDGPLAEHIKAEIQRHRLSDILEFRAGVGVEQVPSILSDCHALLVPLGAHPALSDFVPSKLFDAMAAGRPVLLAATGESRAIVMEHSCGLVVDPENGPQLAESIRLLRDDPALRNRLGSAGRRAAEGMARSHQLDLLDDILCRAVAGASVTDEPSLREDRHVDHAGV